MIYHWCSNQDWETSEATYSSPSLDEEGFIHFSYVDQVERTATSIDRGRDDLVLLCVDESDLDVVVEDCYEAAEEFPHVYGPIPIDTVKAVIPFPCQPDGSFRLPEAVPG